jgi:hypothetical protein
MITDLVKKFELDRLKKFQTNPTTATFLNILENNKEYLSIIMTFMYIAIYTGLDILMPVTFLATRSSAPTTENMNKAIQIVKGLVFRKPIG